MSPENGIICGTAMAEKRLENGKVRYSAAYPTGRELMLEHRYDAPEKLCFGGEPRRRRARRARKGPRAERVYVSLEF